MIIVRLEQEAAELRLQNEELETRYNVGRTPATALQGRGESSGAILDATLPVDMTGGIPFLERARGQALSFTSHSTHVRRAHCTSVAPSATSPNPVHPKLRSGPHDGPNPNSPPECGVSRGVRADHRPCRLCARLLRRSRRRSLSSSTESSLASANSSIPGSARCRKRAWAPRGATRATRSGLSVPPATRELLRAARAGGAGSNLFGAGSRARAREEEEPAPALLGDSYSSSSSSTSLSVAYGDRDRDRTTRRAAERRCVVALEGLSAAAAAGAQPVAVTGEGEKPADCSLCGGVLGRTSGSGDRGRRGAAAFAGEGDGHSGSGASVRSMAGWIR